MWELSLLLLPVAALSGWYAARRGQKKILRQSASSRMASHYLARLGLLEPEADKALDTFLKSMEVNQDTLETHLELAGLFRKRGEVDRAIRIHQYLIARTNLSNDQRSHSLYQLAYDYMRAGLFDRAEELFLELATQRTYQEQSLRQLIEIYQQQHDWERAIQVAEQLAQVTNQSMSISIAHYYCELAEMARDEEDWPRMQDWINNALRINSQSARANLLTAELAIEQGRHKPALRVYQRLTQENTAFIPAILNSIIVNYQLLGHEPEYFNILMSCLQEVGSTAAVVTVLDKLPEFQSDVMAPSIIRQLQVTPSIWGVQALIKLFISDKKDPLYENLHVLQQVVQKIVAEHPLYRCDGCGFASKTWDWWCPSCKSWETIKPLGSLVN